MRLLRWIFLSFVLVGTVVAGAIGYYIYDEYWTKLPDLDVLIKYDPPVATRVLANDGTLIEEFFLERRYLTPIHKIPPQVRLAFVAAEDANFYSHYGFDPVGIARAFYANLVAGEVRQGGSTITQQVVKQLLLTSERKYERKLKEVLLSIRLEREMGKDEILEMYLNQIYFGDGNHGIEAAARSYFRKHVTDLTIAEAALLAGLPQAPSRYSPTRNPKAAAARQRYVLERMEANGFISPGTLDQALREVTEVLPPEKQERRVRNYYTEAVRLELEELFGKQAPYNQGYQVWTAMDVRLQEAAQGAVRRGVERVEKILGYRGPQSHLEENEIADRLAADAENPELADLSPDHFYEAVVTAVAKDKIEVALGARLASVNVAKLAWSRHAKTRKFSRGDIVEVSIREPGERMPADDPGETLYLAETPEVSAAIVSIDLRTGHLVSMVGGYDFLASQFNRALQAQRQPGSAFKPFIYAAALDNGYTPATIVYDERIEYDDNGKIWAPQNYSKTYYGPTRVRTALEKSRNVVTVKMVESIGVNRVVDYISQFRLKAPIGRHLSIGLGTSELTLLDLVAAYTAFANGGVKIEPVAVLKITDSAGRVTHSGSPRYREAISPQTAALITSMLRGVVERGTARRAAAIGRPAAGKTGTTNDQRDAWFIGYTPSMVTGVWVGYDDHRKSMGRPGTGGGVAAPIWLDFMQEALKDTPVEDFDVPSNIRCVNIDPASGLRANEHTESPLLECFKAGTEPAGYNPVWIWGNDQAQPDEGERVAPVPGQAPSNPSGRSFPGAGGGTLPPSALPSSAMQPPGTPGPRPFGTTAPRRPDIAPAPPPDRAPPPAPESDPRFRYFPNRNSAPPEPPAPNY